MGVSGQVKRPAVFLDRDGTLIEQVEMLTEPSQVKLLSGAGEAVAELNRRGFLVFVITNQPIIEKGLLTTGGLEEIHKKLCADLSLAHAHVDGIYVCPHRYRAEGQCVCRKPGVGLIENALIEFPIDMEKSWCIGDRLRDVETGKRAHLRTMQVATGGSSEDDEFFSDTTPDYSADDLAAAARLVV